MPTLQAYENGLTLGWAGGQTPCQWDHRRLTWSRAGCCVRARCCGDPTRRRCCKHLVAKRGEVVGWTAGSVRIHTGFLRSFDTTQLDGMGAAVTLTLLDCPPSSEDWTRLVQTLLQRLRRA